MRYRWLAGALAGVLAALLLVVMACGDDDGGEEAGDGDNGPTATLDGGDGGDDSGDGDDGDDAGDDGDEPTDDAGTGDDDDGSGDDDGGSGDNGFTGEVNPCDLLTVDEVSAALGQPVGEGGLTDFDPFFECDWEGENFDSVNLSVYTDERDLVEQYFEVGNEESEQIDGIGEKAYYDDSIIPSLEILSGNTDILISLVADEDADARSILSELAAAAVERLP